MKISQDRFRAASTRWDAMMTNDWLRLFIALLPLAGCTAWYKPGADEEELTTARQRCEEETQVSSGQPFVECMERAGWRYATFSASTVEPETESPSVTEPPPESPEATEATEAQTESPEVTGKPIQPRRVGGWYQVGEEIEQLQDAKARCHENGVGSKAYYACMQTRGWRPLGFRISIEEPDPMD